MTAHKAWAAAGAAAAAVMVVLLVGMWLGVLDGDAVQTIVLALITAVVGGGGAGAAAYNTRNRVKPTLGAVEKVFGSEGGMATSELLLLVIAVCCVVALVVGWGLVR